MKVTAPSLPAAAVAEKSRWALYADLFKARLSTLVLLTTLVGFYLGAAGPVDYWRLVHTMLGTALVVAAAAALNELWERRFDARMKRTQDRPLPSGRLQPEAVFRLGVLFALAGLVYLAVAVNLTTALLGALSLFCYLFLYTPLKRVTSWNTAVGTIPGGLPPLMGWTAARDGFTPEGLSLLVILALWQIPHFMAIAWIYRDDYARAGFKMLPVVEPDGKRTARHALLSTLLLLLAAVWPFFLGLTGKTYLAGGLLLSLAYVWQARRFALDLNLSSARRLFLVSILYLPLLLGLMVLDKARFY